MGEARRAAAAQALELGLDELARGRVALAVTEMATNLLKHAGNGQVLLAPTPDGALDLLALDQGPGMRGVADCLRDGVSTVGTNGGGLGAIRRAASRFDVYSQPGQGTVVYAGFAAPLASAIARPLYAGLSLAKQWEGVCGDAWSAAPRPAGMDFVVADGLGHGPEAHVAACRAIGLWDAHGRSQGPAAVLEEAHRGLKGTRGAALACVRFTNNPPALTFAGLGNIGGVIVDPALKMRQLVSYNGTAGVEARHFRAFEYPVSPLSVVVLFSDGLISRWSLEAYPGLLRRHPAVIAGVLLRDYNRERDDVTVLVFCPTAPEPTCAA